MRGAKIPYLSRGLAIFRLNFDEIYLQIRNFKTNRLKDSPTSIMNFLAHAYLSFENEEVLLGNMVNDFVKGKQQYSFPLSIQKGLKLHRAIDEFTDNHPVTHQAKQVFKPYYRLYSSAFMDVVYDHFLAISKLAFPEDGLLSFSQRTYAAMARQQRWMPEKFERMFYYMQTQNWLYGYRTKQGMYNSFGGLVKRAAYLQDSTPAIKVFEQEYGFLQNCFTAFWPDMRKFAQERFNELTEDVRGNSFLE